MRRRSTHEAETAYKSVFVENASDNVGIRPFWNIVILESPESVILKLYSFDV